MEQAGLRNGYTTGTCAAAAAKAAAIRLLTGLCPQTVEVPLPSEQRAVLAAVCASESELTRETVCVPEAELTQEKVCAPGRAAVMRVQKDAGDDPDVTHGAWIYAAVSEISPERLETWKAAGAGYWLEDYPQLYVCGGRGIGIATKPGLSCPPGHYAINPTPRQMILAAVEEARQAASFDGCLLAEISIPAGEELAARTFNPRLGIRGGLSVLGTTGIVKPMSEEALRETIRLDIHMKAVSGQRTLLMAPGNYGEAFLRGQLGVPLGEAVLCSNFVGDAMAMLAAEQVKRVLFVSHIGKLIKVSAGIANTHSRYGDGRMAQLERLAAALSVPESAQICARIRECNTTDEAVEVLAEYRLDGQVLTLAARQAKRWMEAWGGGAVEVQAVAFSSVHGATGCTEGAGELLHRALCGESGRKAGKEEP